MDKKQLYKQAIMDHYNNSPHRGQIANPSFTTDETSPSCGDRIIFDVVVEDGQIKVAKFRGEGSILGQAAASMLIDHMLGKGSTDALSITENDLLGWLGIELGPTRKRTVVFILQSLQNGIREYCGA